MAVVTVCKDADDLAAQAADLVVQAARVSIEARGRFLIALAGGSTPEKTYDLLAQPQRASEVDWTRIFVFFGDERLVPHYNDQSNYALADRTLFKKVPIPKEQIYGIETHWETADEAASDYDETLTTFFEDTELGIPPRFDLILLGLGDDGHTASLFPGMPSLDVKDKWAVGSPPGILPPPVDRITLTYPVLNAARQIAFLAAGEKKAEAVHAVLEGGADHHARPAAGVKPDDGAVTWLLDEAATKLLTDRSSNS